MENKKARGEAKEVVTSKIKEITRLMADANNAELVANQLRELKGVFRNFQATHEAFHNQLGDKESIEQSAMYYELVSDQVKQLQDNIELWLAGIETSKLIKSLNVYPDDSVSNAGSPHDSITSRASRKSSASGHSSFASARARAAAKKAILQAEAATMKKLHQIQDEELKLRQRKMELRIETEMAKATAEELAYAEVEVQEMSARPLHEEDNLHEVPLLSHASNFITLDEVSATPKEEVKLMEPRMPGDVSTAIKLRESCRPHPLKQETPLANQRSLNPAALEFRFETVMPQQPIRSSEPQLNQPSDMQQLLQQQQQVIMALTLPQPKLPVFTGDPIEYCDFIRAFENLNERKTISPSARLYYLLQYTGGQVRDLVRSCLAMREDTGYREATRLLAERSGQPYKIATAYVDCVVNGQPIRAEDSAALQKYSILLTSCSNTFKEIGYLSRLENPDSLRKIVDRLPFPLKLKWREVADAISQHERRDATLEDITCFVEARSRVVYHPIFGKISGEPKPINASDKNKLRRGVRAFTVQGHPQRPNG